MRTENLILREWIESGEASDGALDDTAYDASLARSVRVAARQALARRAGREMGAREAWAQIVRGRSAYRERKAERDLRRKADHARLSQIAREISELYRVAMTSSDWAEAVNAYHQLLRLRHDEQETQVRLGERKRLTQETVDRAAAERLLVSERLAKIEAFEAEMVRLRAQAERDAVKKIPPKRRDRLRPLRPADPPPDALR